MSTRTLTHAFVLYPDNVHQMQLLAWLESPVNSANFGYKMCYILHQPETDEKKQHYHVMVQYPNARTSEGVKKSFGVYRTVWRLYHMQVNATIDKTLHKPPKGFQAQTLTGYIRQTKTKDKLVPVLTDSANPESFVDVEYHGRERVCPVKPGLTDEIYKLTPLYTVPHVEPVSDSKSYAQYMLHRTYECWLADKHKYSFNDLQGDSEYISILLGGEYSETAFNVTKLVEYYKAYQQTACVQTFLEFLLGFEDGFQAVEFIRKNPYFVSTYITPNLNLVKKKGEKE